jgi:hypothetical protein
MLAEIRTLAFGMPNDLRALPPPSFNLLTEQVRETSFAADRDGVSTTLLEGLLGYQTIAYILAHVAPEALAVVLGLAFGMPNGLHVLSIDLFTVQLRDPQAGWCLGMLS